MRLWSGVKHRTGYPDLWPVGNDHPVDIETIDRSGLTPLNNALCSENKAMVRLLLDQNTVGFRPGAIIWIFSAVSVSCPGKVPPFKISKLVLCAIQGVSFRGQERSQLYVFRTTDWRRDSSP